MTQTRLYIFTTSVKPDPYINAIAHCAADYRELNRVTLIDITEDKGKSESKEEKLEKLKQDINDQLDNLSKGKYLDHENNNCKDIQVEPAACRRYSNLKSIPLDIRVWAYQDLEQEISILLESSMSFTYIFDVTAVIKRQLIDIYSILRLKNFSAIHSFELNIKGPLSHDDKELIHNLDYGETYKYPCFSESIHLSGAENF